MALAAFLTPVQSEAQPRQGGARGPDIGPAPMMRETTEADPDELLDEEFVTDPARLQAAREQADRPPPASSDPDVLAEFFWGRSKAARTSGREDQALADLRQAVTHARRGRSPRRASILADLAEQLADRLQPQESVRLMLDALGMVPPGQRGRIVAMTARLARYQAQTGDLEAATQSLARAIAQLETLRGAPEVLRPVATQVAVARGRVAMLRGDFAEAEQIQRGRLAELAAADGAPGMGNPDQIRLGLATVLRAQGRLEEAENEARQALVGQQRRYGVTSPHTSHALTQLAQVLAEQGRGADAQALARKAVELLRATGRGGAGARLILAGILVADERYGEAMAEFDATRRVFPGDSPERFESAVGPRNLNLPLALLKTGRTDEAYARLNRLAADLRRTLGDRHALTAQARGFLALALAERGQVDPALREFAEAVPVLLDRSRRTDDDGGAAAADRRLRLVLEGYIDLLAQPAGAALAARNGIDAAAESFRLADAARGRSVLAALSAAAARMAAGNPALAEAARAAQDAEKQISALNGLLANAISARADDQDAAAIQALRSRIDALRDQRGRAQEQLERRFPEYARLVDPRPATAASLQGVLRSDEVLAAFFVGEKRSYAWAVGPDGKATFATAPLGHAQIAAAVARIRRGVEPNAAGELPPFDVKAAHALYAALLGPLDGVLRSARNVYVVPHGPLGQIPFALLPTAPAEAARADADGVAFSRYRAVPWLIRRVAVVQLPAVGSLASLRALPPGSPARRPFVAFADPVFAPGRNQASGGRTATRGAPRPSSIVLRAIPPQSGAFAGQLAQLPRLPDTSDEVRSVAEALHADPDQDLFLGPRASEGSVRKANLSRYRVVMFATHGLIPGDLAGLTQPALALSSPQVAGDGGNGLLTVDEILSLRLDADWVVLSACNTAAGQGAGAEAVSGLGRAFFYAGARALLVTNWPVETVSARLFTTDAFRRQAEDPSLPRAQALRQAMLALIDGPGAVDASGKPVYSYAHPVFWAPFSLVGDGGASAAAR